VSGAIIAAVIPLAFLVAGLVALGAGALVLRTFGPRYRVGRLLSTTPRVTVAEAIELAGRPPRYVAVRGRIDAEEPFEDDAHRPLVHRRTRLERRDGTAWIAFDDRRESVDFEIREGLDGIVVDAAALEDGLVVVRREAVGTAGEIAEQAPGLPADTPVRLRIEQVSAVEHAIVAGVPAQRADGSPHLTAGLGRPLILTTLEQPEAMRLLADGRSQRPLAAAICFAGGLGLVTIGLAAAVVEAVP
jgi:hypothetical protein